jgi:hypothetical protein
MKVWEALNYLCRYVQYTPICVICICTKVCYAMLRKRSWTGLVHQCSKVNIGLKYGYSSDASLVLDHAPTFRMRCLMPYPRSSKLPVQSQA